MAEPQPTMAHARTFELDGIAEMVADVQGLIDRRFQDLYRTHYADWIRQDDAPMVFTHQFLDRVLKPHTSERAEGR